jgi:sulfate transport system ATP-binding protein
VNRLPCRISGGKARIGQRGPRIDAGQLADGDAIAYVRPHEIELLPADERTACLARVRSLSIIGPRTRLHLEHESLVLEADADRQLVDALRLAPGQMVGIRLQTVRLFPCGKADARTVRVTAKDGAGSP